MARPPRIRTRFRLSIRDKILVAFLFVVLLMSAVTALFMVRALQFDRQYSVMLNNATIANRLSSDFKTRIDSALWDTVAGKSVLEGGPAYAIMDELNGNVQLLMQQTESRRGRLKLDVVLRTVSTLRTYMDRMADRMENGSTVADNEQFLDQARWLSGLVQELFNDYMVFEVNRMGLKAEQVQRNFRQWLTAVVVLLAAAITFSIVSAWRISKGIYLPIKRLHDAAFEVTQHDVDTLVRGNNVDELAELDESFNQMVGQIRALLDAKVEEQDRLKKAELRALQAQINPHFLYNTLDTIIWKAEANQKEQVIALVQALSSFFRISLSKGKDWIPVRDEIEHVRSYLAIQGMRYHDILRYRVDLDEGIGDATVLKLTLQPLVENAIYHGIKNRRGGGTVTVRARALDPSTLIFEVKDDGVGIPRGTLDTLQRELDGDGDLSQESVGGVGMRNVNERIKLFYGEEYGLRVESSVNEGTTVSLVIPRVEG
jgi:two-component system sensor histidine kinase YesM